MGYYPLIFCKEPLNKYMLKNGLFENTGIFLNNFLTENVVSLFGVTSNTNRGIGEMRRITVENAEFGKV